MGLFDFPRIHFAGNVDINVPTINNSYYFPLTIYDATQSKAFLPPRLYFSSEAVINNVPSSINPEIHFDENNQYYYIKILPISTIEILRKWCMNPLGVAANAPDAAYFPYYVAADADLGQVEGSFIVGNCMGYWNMYGDMGVAMSNVQVTGVQTFDGTNLNTWTSSSQNIPPSVLPFLSASFDMDTTPASGITTATMVETISSQSVYASIFCSNVNLFSGENNILLQGKPFRFSALAYGAWRVVNWFPAMAGSARFCSSIPLEDISQGEQAQLIQFFSQNNGYDGRTLKGVFVTFTTFEVFENRYDQNYYNNNGTKPNPATATTVGSITPWYEGDMRTGVLGRNLISLNMNPIYQNTNSAPPNTIPVNMQPAISSLRVLKNGSAVFSVDMGNSWPEVISPPYNPNSFQPPFRGDASFETANLGNLNFQYSNNPSSIFASIAVNPAYNPRSSVFQTGGIFDFVLTNPTLIQNIQNNFIRGYLSNGASNAPILQESVYMFTTDEKGLYGEEGAAASAGYQVFDENLIPCRLRIFQKGVPVTQPIPVLIAQYIVPEAANDPLNGPNNTVSQMLADNSIVQLTTGNLTMDNNAVYYFVYSGQYTQNNIPPFATQTGYTVMDTGSFVCLRVHKMIDYSQYLNPSNPNYTPPDFAVVYEEVFKMYDVAYPAMALVHPFDANVWNNGTIAGLVVQRTDPKFWNDILYMPRSRELSASQRKLLVAWANNVKDQ